MITKQELDRLKALEKNATQGPWEVNNKVGTWSIYSIPKAKVIKHDFSVGIDPSIGTVAWSFGDKIETMGCRLYEPPTAQFIAESRNLLPKLIESFEVMRDALKKLTEVDYINVYKDGEFVKTMYQEDIASEALSKAIGEK